MTKKHEIVLPNSVKVSFYPKKDTLERMLEIANTPDFLEETEIMKKLKNFPPASILVYDDFMALGLYDSGGNNTVGFREYKHDLLMEYVDWAIALRGHAIRIVEKTSKKDEIFERLKPVIDYEWVEYDKPTQALREKTGVPCEPEKIFENLPLTDEAFAISDFGPNEVKTVHMKIKETYSVPNSTGGLKGVICEGQGRKFYENAKIEEIEEKLRKSYPNALIVREPFAYCSHGCKAKPFSCIAVKFERAYARKKGMEVPEGIGEGPSFNGFSQN